MALTNAFFEAVSSRNIRRIRIMMKDSLLVDPSFSEFHKMENEASGVIDLYDIHDGGEFLVDKSLWNDSYMNDLMVQVVINFSHERIEHLQQVVHFLRPLTTKTQYSQEQKKQESDNQNNTGNYKETRTQNQENRSNFSFSSIGRGSKISCGALIGGVVGGSIASAVSASVISGLVIGAALGAIIVTVSTNGE